GDLIRQTFASTANIQWIEQASQLGTGHAVLQTLPFIGADDGVLILYGDVPLISLATLQRLMQETARKGIGLVTGKIKNPTGYGRIKRDQHSRVVGIVEEKEANMEERGINEINSGIYFMPSYYLKKWLPLIQANQQQQEFYLTNIFSLACQ